MKRFGGVAKGSFVSLTSVNTVGGFTLDRFVSVLMVSSATTLLNRAQDSNGLFVAGSVGTLIALAVIAFFAVAPSASRGWIERPSFVWACVACAVAGLVCFSTPAVSGGEDPALFGVAAALLGTGSAGLFVRWGIVFSTTGSKTMLVEVAVGYLLGMALSTVCSAFGARPPLAIPAAALVLDGASVLKADELLGEKDDLPVAGGGMTGGLLWKTCLGLACFGCAFGCLSQTLGLLSAPHLSPMGNLIKLTCGLILVVLATVLAYVTKDDLIAKAYKAAFLIVLMGSLALIAVPNLPDGAAVLVFVGGMAIIVMGMSVLFNLAHRSRHGQSRIVMEGTAAFVVGDLAFRTVDLVFLQRGLAATPTFHLALLAGLVALTYALVFTERDLLKVETLEHVPAEEGVGGGIHEVIGARYGLTDRETEVLKYLVSGRSSRRIQEELLISESTVHTHTRHVYQKLGIHSKQELLDMVEALRGR